MLIPVRCFTCNKVVASKWNTYKHLLEQNISENDALNQIGFARYCCRRMFLGHVELHENELIAMEAMTIHGDKKL